MRACVPACVVARARGRVHVRARVSLLIQNAMCMRHIVLLFVASLVPSEVLTLSHTRQAFRKKNILNIKCVFSFPLQLYEKQKHFSF